MTSTQADRQHLASRVLDFCKGDFKMSGRGFDPSRQIFRRPSTDDSSPSRETRSSASQNSNGKRSLDDFQEEQMEVPRKIARLDADHSMGREEPQQSASAIASASNPKQKHEFVDGPGHIVLIEERGKHCPAICFNKALFSRFTDIAITSREVRERDKDMRKAESELQRIMFSNQSPSLEQAKRTVDEAVKNQKDLEAEIPDLVEAQQHCERLARENKWSKELLERSKEVVRCVIEQILDRENLLNIPTSQRQKSTELRKDHQAKFAPLPEKTVHHTEFPKVRQRSSPSSSDEEDRPANPARLSEKTVHDAETSKVPERSPASSTTRLDTPINTEKQLTPRQLALRHLRFAAEDLDYANRHFAYMQEEYAQEVAADLRHRRQLYPDRPESFTQTDIDLKCLQEKRKVTREVIEAEEAYDRAEQDAENLGLGDSLADPHACYWGEIHNCFSPPTVRGLSMSSSDRSRIEAWMASIPDSVAVGLQRPEAVESAEVDEWEAKSVEISESVSLVAYDMYRKKIDTWQDISGHLR